MYSNSSQFPLLPLLPLLRTRPQAIADVTGSEAYPAISGTVRFWQTQSGVIVYTEIRGLPSSQATCGDRFFAYHIHDGGSCTGNSDDPFADAGTHDNPDDCPHPAHAGDLPPLLENRGYALSIILTNRICIQEIIGKAVIIHSQPDDFTTQPSGNAGTKIACGIIHRNAPCR